MWSKSTIGIVVMNYAILRVESTIGIVVMNYAILRVEKLKTNTQVRGSLKHAFRAQATPNADPSRESLNTHIGADSVISAMEAFKGRLPEKVRKNGVRCIEYLMTASPEKMGEMSKSEQDAYFDDSLKWLKEKHGAENVVYAGIHRDETTPHMYAYVVPIDEKGKLNCRSFLGGSKHVLSELQDEFADKVGKAHGLDRGVKGSKAKHVRIQDYYKNIKNTTLKAIEAPEIDASEFKPKVLKSGMLSKVYETPEMIKSRVDQEIQKSTDEVNRSLQQVADRARAESMKNIELERELAKLNNIRKLDAKTKRKLNEEAKILKEKEDEIRQNKSEQDKSQGR